MGTKAPKHWVLKTSEAPWTVGDPLTGLCNPKKIQVKGPGNGSGRKWGTSFLSVQVFFYGPELSSDGSEIIIHFNTPTNKRDNDKLTTNTNIKRSRHRVVRAEENFIKIFCIHCDK